LPKNTTNEFAGLFSTLALNLWKPTWICENQLESAKTNLWKPTWISENQSGNLWNLWKPTF